MERIKIRILGVRGTAPIVGEDVKKYGGTTSCIFIRIGGECIVLDAGTGLLSIRKYLEDEEKTFHILLSHPHLDHMEGIPACPLCLEPEFKVSIYAVEHSELSTLEQVQKVMSPPLWPVKPDVFTAKVSFHDIKKSTFFIGKVKIDTMEGNHPGGCTVFRISYKDVSIVYATDFEQDTKADERLYKFAKDCDLFLCDGEYRKDELLKYRGFGHSTWEFTASMGKRCNASQIKIIHHALRRTDNELDTAEKEIMSRYSNCSFAKMGEEIII